MVHRVNTRARKDLKYRDLDGNKTISIGENRVEAPVTAKF